jgi:hypothetical protein
LKWTESPEPELRALDRAERLRLMRFRAFVANFTRLAGRPPTEAELRQALGLPPR